MSVEASSGLVIAMSALYRPGLEYGWQDYQRELTAQGAEVVFTMPDTFSGSYLTERRGPPGADDIKAAREVGSIAARMERLKPAAALLVVNNHEEVNTEKLVSDVVTTRRRFGLWAEAQEAAMLAAGLGKLIIFTNPLRGGDYSDNPLFDKEAFEGLALTVPSHMRLESRVGFIMSAVHEHRAQQGT